MEEYSTAQTNNLIDGLEPDMITGGSIPLHEPLCFDYIQAGLVSREFVDYFGSYPYSEDKTEKYHFTIRRVDQLINMRIWKIA
jgi:hypothetical protein